MTKAIFASTLITLLLTASCGAPPYTAKVVDAETGEPIEGAVYLAVWWGTTTGEKAWFEGPSTVMSKFVEGYTDGGGEIHVPRFWFRYPFAKERTLTVYKPGYVLWNQEYVFPTREKRAGFGTKSREVRMEKWKDEYSYGAHEDFLTLCVKSTMTDGIYWEGEKRLREAFLRHEISR